MLISLILNLNMTGSVTPATKEGGNYAYTKEDEGAFRTGKRDQELIDQNNAVAIIISEWLINNN